MDAPALPPSPSNLQSNVPALVVTVDIDSDSLEVENISAASEIDPTLISRSELLPVGDSLLPMDALPKSAFLDIHALDFSFFSQRRVIAPLSWLPSTQLSQSFGFMNRAFRSAKLDNALRFAQLSATVPVKWSQSEDWKSWAKVAEVDVMPVEPAEQSVVQENEAWSAPFSVQCLVSDRRTLAEKTLYRLSLRETTLGYVADRDQAYSLAQQLEQLLSKANFDADKIAPQLGRKKLNDKQSELVISAADKALFAVDESMAEAVGYSEEWAAIAWANNLRTALDAEPMTVGAAQTALKNMEPSEITLKGDASWYGPYFHGRATANGETYNQHDLTVAHKSLPFGTHLKVRNLQNGRSVVVRVNDRGPYVGDRSLDLSNAAAKCLGSDEAGVIPYEAVILKKAN